MMIIMSWDTANNHHLGEMVGHTKKVNSVSYKPTRPFRVMSASEDMKTCCYVGPPFKLDHSDNSAHSNFVNCVRYSPDGNRCVSGYNVEMSTTLSSILLKCLKPPHLY
jgi:WD40 repeat protein